MIQPVSALSPRAVFRGSSGTYEIATKGKEQTKYALLNAGALATAAGGLTTLVARAHTTNLLHAIVIGICGAFLSLFFMTPQLIEKTAKNQLKNKEADILVKEESKKFFDVVKEQLKPASKRIHFKQQA